jgi:hypothetical protein
VFWHYESKSSVLSPPIFLLFVLLDTLSLFQNSPRGDSLFSLGIVGQAPPHESFSYSGVDISGSGDNGGFLSTLTKSLLVVDVDQEAAIPRAQPQPKSIHYIKIQPPMMSLLSLLPRGRDPPILD